MAEVQMQSASAVRVVADRGTVVTLETPTGSYVFSVTPQGNLLTFSGDELWREGSEATSQGRIRRFKEDRQRLSELAQELRDMAQANWE